MLDINTGEQIQALYRLIEVKGGKRVEKFSSTDINEVINFHKEFIKKYRQGLLMEILPEKKTYDWKEKKVSYSFE
ncbi:hypothetical protein IJ750_01560 [bacterium]|nr:hypothetical protein [bacterium]